MEALIAPALLVLFFALLIGIFVRLGNRGQKRTGATCTFCRSYIDPRATVCPACSRDVDRAAVAWQLRVAYYTRLALVTAGIVAFFYIYSNMPAPAEPLLAQQNIFRDDRGRTTGTATTSGNMTTYRDSSGRTIGTGTTDNSGTTTFRDGSGRTTGTSTAPRGGR
jgi:hypothetical protein